MFAIEEIKLTHDTGKIKVPVAIHLNVFSVGQKRS
jgi:hypothetical protein